MAARSSLLCLGGIPNRVSPSRRQSGCAILLRRIATLPDLGPVEPLVYRGVAGREPVAALRLQSPTSSARPAIS